MNVQALQQIMEQHPNLTDFGFGVYDGRKMSKAEREESIRCNRDALLDGVEDFRKTVEWIRVTLTPIQTINTKHSSYELKHIAEKEIGYITNGVFIAAMFYEGYRFEVDGPNAWFNISEKPITAKRKELYGGNR